MQHGAAGIPAKRRVRFGEQHLPLLPPLALVWDRSHSLAGDWGFPTYLIDRQTRSECQQSKLKMVCCTQDHKLRAAILHSGVTRVCA